MCLISVLITMDNGLGLKRHRDLMHRKKVTVAASVLTDRQVPVTAGRLAGEGLKLKPSLGEELTSGGLFQKGRKEEKWGPSVLLLCLRSQARLRKEPLQADVRERSRLRKQLSPNPVHSSARISKHLGRRRVSQVFQTLGIAS